MTVVVADNSIMTSSVNAADSPQETVYFCDRLPMLFNQLSARMASPPLALTALITACL